MKAEIPSYAHLPKRIERLGDLAYNLWWSWRGEARDLFKRLDRTLWRKSRHNPIQILQEVSTETLQERAADPDFLNQYDEVVRLFDEYMAASDTWYSQQAESEPQLVAYFCAEFAVHGSLPIYSGGLGLLAGDTCKEASDLGLPFVGVGTLYPEGYFHQRIAADGFQEAIYQRLNLERVPLLPVCNDDGSRLIVSVPVGDREVGVAVWKAQVGRVPIYFMDTDISENELWDRDLVARLYGGDDQVRIRQEIILGVGGVRVLRALGFEPTVLHLNEGHAAFASIELIREDVESGMSFREAVENIRGRIVFTTHTPVKAGHDEFPYYMIEEHFSRYWSRHGIPYDDFLALGSVEGSSHFSMTVLALKTSARSNGVSRKHGEVSRRMWNHLFPDREENEVPIFSITNGVHVPTWLAGEMIPLLTRYLGQDWLSRHDEQELWDRVFEIPDEELWEVHEKLKLKLLSIVRERARTRWMADGISPGQIVAFGALLNPQALTIGFARRFATYKRAGLILRDVERLKVLLLNPWRPVQIVFAGKAHPADEPGRHLLKQIFDACADNRMGGHIAFIEDYDKYVAHHLVQGVDLWLNNPEPPKEASGTSGQKASLNGIANCSVLDGWWYEGYNDENGWAIEGGSDDEAADSLYALLENEIVPLFYDRDSAGIPRGWINLMKNSIRSTAAPFSTRRMVKEYWAKLYQPSQSLSHAK